MNYLVLGKSVSIDTMQKPKGGFGSVFEFTGSDSLNEIGLNQKFWFRCNHGFSNELPVSQNQTEIISPQNDYQRVLSIFLEKCIRNRRLTGQYEEPVI
ncbi:MAG: hypothetical protein HY252_17020 [Sphingobacteriales bacterium]|nr:hypothetical protein [Sphingobacteriales bacterium]